ncbi:MAG: hypothetical protein FWE44_06360 [Defluviitaleaceae bacterium]|nr:hypothetical protein [Defluviitaleaceae bacterium]
MAVKTIHRNELPELIYKIFNADEVVVEQVGEEMRIVPKAKSEINASGLLGIAKDSKFTVSALFAQKRIDKAQEDEVLKGRYKE